MDRKLIAVDFDGTLTTGEGKWWKDDPIFPNKKMIDWVDKMYKKGHVIVIHSARPWSVSAKTVAWLIEQGIRYHGVNFEKMSADIYIDDKAVNIKDVK